MTWTAERIDELTRLWNEGQSASAIGKQLGISKNAVVGKAHRLKLESRPSPIRRQEAASSTPPRKRSDSLAMPGHSESSGEKAETARQAAAQANQAKSAASPVQTAQSSTQKVKSSTQKAKSPAQTTKSSERPQPASARPSTRQRPAPASPKPSQSEAGASNRKCQWPIGDPSKPDFHFCESPAVAGRPYCAEHCAMAYITRSKDRSSEAA